MQVSVSLRAEILETRSGPASSVEAAEQNLGSKDQLHRQAGLHPPEHVRAVLLTRPKDHWPCCHPTSQRKQGIFLGDTVGK